MAFDKPTERISVMVLASCDQFVQGVLIHAGKAVLNMIR